jgi:hypothetical protein
MSNREVFVYLSLFMLCVVMSYERQRRHRISDGVALGARRFALRSRCCIQKPNKRAHDADVRRNDGNTLWCAKDFFKRLLTSSDVFLCEGRCQLVFCCFCLSLFATKFP